MKIAIIPGDGIGKEVIAEGIKLLESLDIEYDIFNYDADYWIKYGKGIGDDEIENFRKNYSAIYFGALGDERLPKMEHGKAILLKLRFELELYANIRPIKMLKPELSPLKKADKIDFVIIRENTEDLYRGIGGSFKTGHFDEVVIDQRIHTRKGVTRIIKYAFEYAIQNNRKSVMLVDKHNAIPNGGQLWLEIFETVSKKYPQIKTSYEHVDIAAAKMVMNPEKFDVVVTSNLFGDILSDLGAGIIGGVGLSASSNINVEGIGLFEPVHGSAPDITGMEKANPIAAFETLAMLFGHLNLYSHEKYLKQAIEQSIKDEITTPDLGGTYTTSQVGNYIVKLVHEYITNNKTHDHLLNCKTHEEALEA